MQLMQDSLPFDRRNDECFTLHRTWLSSMVRVSLCCQYGQRGWGTSLMPLGQPVMMMSGERSHFWVTDEGFLESFLVGWHYVGMVDSDIQWKVRAWPGDWIQRVHLVWPYLCLGSNRLWGHIPAGIASCIGAMQAVSARFFLDIDSSGLWSDLIMKNHP